MPQNEPALRELATLLSTLAHPQRIRIIEELRRGEADVNTLTAALGCQHSRVSQHLSKLKAQRLVSMRRDGRHVYYRLTAPAVAAWLVQGLDFIAGELTPRDKIHSAVEHARAEWLDNGESAAS